MSEFKYLLALLLPINWVKLLVSVSVIFGGVLAIRSASLILRGWFRAWMSSFPGPGSVVWSGDSIPVRLKAGTQGLLVATARIAAVIFVAANILFWFVVVAAAVGLAVISFGDTPVDD